MKEIPEVPLIGLDDSRVVRCAAFTFPGEVVVRAGGLPDIPRVRSYRVETSDEFTAHVEMEYKPVRLPARVRLHVRELVAVGQHPARTYECLPLTPAAARDLAALLIACADKAEAMDKQPYPPPEETTPPLVAAGG